MNLQRMRLLAGLPARKSLTEGVMAVPAVGTRQGTNEQGMRMAEKGHGEYTEEGAMSLNEKEAVYHSVFTLGDDGRWSHYFDADSPEDAKEEAYSLKNQGHKVKVFRVPQSQADWGVVDPDTFVKGQIAKKIEKSPIGNPHGNDLDEAGYEMDEKAPPGMEHMVRQLKKEYPGHEEKAFATAWSIYNKKHGKTEEGYDMDEAGGALYRGSIVEEQNPEVDQALELFKSMVMDSYVPPEDAYDRVVSSLTDAGNSELISAFDAALEQEGFAASQNDEDIPDQEIRINPGQGPSADEYPARSQFLETEGDTHGLLDAARQRFYDLYDNGVDEEEALRTVMRELSQAGAPPEFLSNLRNDITDFDTYSGPDDYSDDAEALASAGHGSDEDYGDFPIDENLSDHVHMGAKVYPEWDQQGEPFEVIKIVDDQQVIVKDDFGNIHTMMIRDLVPYRPEVAEDFNLNNGYDDRHVAKGSDYFPNGADGPVNRAGGAAGARQGDNPEQKRMQVAETHKEFVYKYRDYLKESFKD